MLSAYIESINEDIVAYRRFFHENPELSNKEFKTSSFIADELTRMNISFKRQDDSTGIIATIGKNNNRCIAFRADMDALPISEENDVCYKSKNDGCMHACGHDAHSAILLALAKVLKHFEDRLEAKVLLVFQPAEEDSPNGGAKRIIASKELDEVDLIYGLHMWPEAKHNEVVFKSGPLMAASDHFYVDIQGRASHAAEPHKGIDALVAASHWVCTMQSIIAREISPFENAVFTIGTFNSGNRYNVVSGLTKIEGTCRTYNPLIRDKIENRMNESLKAIDSLFNTTSKLDYQRGYCSLINNKEAIEFAKNIALKNNISIKEIDEPSMCAEDFAFYLNKFKGAFLWLGCGLDDSYALHHPKFNIDESVLKTGVLLFASIALEFK